MTRDLLPPLFTEYSSAKCDTIAIQTKTPKVSFSKDVPSFYVNQFLKYMSLGDIKIEDYQGNTLNIKIY